ncbi:uncharacterized protein EURHEDRAFT_405380 [Aspergillus ruber CBS 135680]|uniref:Uncharacterized protein n=1 Tax=Aspergillus ruber (strain CBS 135680) TaxID=1388766 RepID=A0A017S5Y6_ASPRC|nr:uncharacterized protein EURHEDRAFT_405380 [Aspergillus ruber CBS 135680]EYE92271.1 hypothetical protein EURHEDRAFT_405380 [Aspergillus ruber CBS 135680]
MALADQENFTVSNHLLSPEESPPTTRTTTTVTDTKNKDNSKQSTVRFWPQIYVPILVLLYTAILLTAWSIFCVLSRGSMASIPNVLNHYKYSPDVEAALKANERWYRAARVLWGIIGVSTIPVASSVWLCSGGLCSIPTEPQSKLHAKTNPRTCESRMDQSGHNPVAAVAAWIIQHIFSLVG